MLDERYILQVRFTLTGDNLAVVGDVLSFQVLDRTGKKAISIQIAPWPGPYPDEKNDPAKGSPEMKKG